jgi:gliding motility-associated-like protein
MRILLISTILITGYACFGQASLRRVCKAGSNNELLFFQSTDTCSRFVGYFVWAKNGVFSPFVLIDSILNQTANTYQHIGAPGNDWYYTIETRDSCGPIFKQYTDTIQVDALPPTETLFDSISVTEQNKVILGWKSNNTPDFAYYNLYYDSIGLNAPLVFFYTDTQYLDNRPNCRPDINPIQYFISPVDSCENQRVFTNSHKTIYLEFKLDTCNATVSLNWSSYSGWQQIRTYYVYRSTNGGLYELIDSTTNNTFLIPLELGKQLKYFVRGYKAIENISSSSNRIEFSTRKRVEPDSVYITSIDVQKPENGIIAVKWFTKLNEAVRYEIWGANDSAGPFLRIEDIIANPNSTNYNKSLNSTSRFYRLESINACGISFQSINIARTISTYISERPNGVLVSWDRYFTWNTGVANYDVFRSTNTLTSAYDYITTVNGTDTFFLDIPPSDAQAPCYYVVANQQLGDINIPVEKATSFQSCLVGEANVLIPNAFRPTGLNNEFKPEGTFINYEKSTLQVFDRWGGPVVYLKGIREGWNGTFSDGTPASQGVYYYLLTIESTNGNIKTYTGFVTLLN